MALFLTPLSIHLKIIHYTQIIALTFEEYWVSCRILTSYLLHAFLLIKQVQYIVLAFVAHLLKLERYGDWQGPCTRMARKFGQRSIHAYLKDTI